MLLECKNLVLGYNRALTAPINLAIADDQWIGIIGKNGIGKSTFLKTVLGLRKSFSGELKVLGQAPGAVNRQISYIPQEREINLAERMSGFSLIVSSYNGWHYGCFFTSHKLKTRVNQLIELVGATEYAHQPFNTLSGGQKKRIFLAQALVNQPRMLLLDEPLADLDPAAKQQFIYSLQQIHRHEKVGLLIIAHDMHEIAEHLDGFIHFRSDGVHYCETISCVKEDSYVGI